MENNRIVIYTDGGARGNPGPAACGYVIDGAAYGEYLGHATNNEAEYKGVIEALKKVFAQLGKEKALKTEIEVMMDSELVVRQFCGLYKVKQPHLKVLFTDAHNEIQNFKKVSFKHIPREQNKLADAMVNKILDEREK
jgi:ribonuclease HI